MRKQAGPWGISAITLGIALAAPLAWPNTIQVAMWRSPRCSGMSLKQVVPSTCAQGTSCQIIANASTEAQSITETAGDLLVAIAYSGQCVGCSSGTTAGGAAPNMVFQVSDTLGNQYHAAPLLNNGRYNAAAMQIFFASNIAGGSNTVTATSSGNQLTGHWTGLVLYELSGVAASNVVDISSGQTLPASSSTSTSAGNMTLGTNCDLIVGGMADGHVNSSSATAGTGWTEPLLDQWDPAAFVYSLNQTRNTTVNATINGLSSSDNGWVAGQTAFRAATTAAPAQPTQLAFTTSAQAFSSSWSCSGAVTVQAQNASGAATSTSTGITVNLSGTGFTFFADSTCDYPVTSIYIGAGTSSQSFYFTAPVGATTITASAAGFSSISQTETISAAGMPISLVQQATGSWSSGSSYTISLGSAPASGDVLVLGSAGAGTTVSISSLSQTGVTWSKATSTTTNKDVEIWYGVAGASAGTTLTVTLSRTATAAIDGNLSEWSGIATSSELLSGGYSSTSGTSATPTTSLVSPTSGKSALIYGVALQGGTFSSGPTGGFTALSTPNSSWQFGYVLVPSTTGSYSTGWVYSSSAAWASSIATLSH